jgi:uncharacterized membrane protein YfcA
MRHEAYPLLLAAGMAAGFVNTLAGGGSHLTLPLLILLGFDPNTANGTNRIAVLTQNLGAVAGFARHGRSPGRQLLELLPVSIAGAYVGARVAVDVPPAVLKAIVVTVILLTLPVLKLSPRQGQGQAARAAAPPGRALLHTVFFGIAFYAGFLQAGVGFLILAAAVPFLGLDLVSASVLKVALILVHTLVALPVFLAHGQVNLPAGLLLGLGSLIGAWIGARAAIRRGQRFVRAVIVAGILLSIAALLELPARLLELFHG